MSDKIDSFGTSYSLNKVNEKKTLTVNTAFTFPLMP